jgi:hypothetical protein
MGLLLREQALNMAEIRIWNPLFSSGAPYRSGSGSNRREVITLAHKKYRIKKYRRNPLGFTGQDGSRILWGSVGYVAARAVPAMVLPAKNTGLIGYAMNLATALALKFVLRGDMGDSMFVGGAVATVTRVVSDQLGTKIQGLSGDPAFTMGAYWQSYFAVPTVSDPYGRVSASPYPAPALPPPAAGMSGYAGAAGARGVPGGRFTAGRFG